MPSNTASTIPAPAFYGTFELEPDTRVARSTHYVVRLDRSVLCFAHTLHDAEAMVEACRMSGVTQPSRLGIEELEGEYPADEQWAALAYEAEIANMDLDESEDDDEGRTESIDWSDTAESARISLYLERADIGPMTKALLRRDQLPCGFAECAMDDDGAVLQMGVGDALAIETMLRDVAISSSLRDQFARARRSTFRLV